MQTTILDLTKMAEIYTKGQKTLGKGEIAMTSNFSFSYNVFERLVLQTCKNKGFFLKGLSNIEVVACACFQFGKGYLSGF